MTAPSDTWVRSPCMGKLCLPSTSVSLFLIFFLKHYPDTWVLFWYLQYVIMTRHWTRTKDSWLASRTVSHSVSVVQGGQTIYAPLDYWNFWLIRPISPQWERTYSVISVFAQARQSLWPLLAKKIILQVYPDSYTIAPRTVLSDF